MDIDQLATEAEADRLSCGYLRIKLLAKKRRIEFAAADAAAVREGLETEADWELVRAAVTAR